MAARLHQLLEASAARCPDSTALLDAGGRSATYRELDAGATFIAGLLRQAGVIPGDRVGLYAPKSIPLVSALFGILKAGAAYVPVDPSSPAARVAYIFGNCAVKAIIGSESLLARLAEIDGGAGHGRIGEIDGPAQHGEPLIVVRRPGAADSAPANEITDLAYILYTSGSTGQPKGVMHRHASALSFLDWCSSVLSPQPEDRFSSHAPFHFDLSILDIYVPITHGASLVLIDDQLGKRTVLPESVC